MSHNGVDIDQFLLLTIYPSILFFITGFIFNKYKSREKLKYLVQSIICFSFSIFYFIAIPNGGAQGIAIVLFIFAILLLILLKRSQDISDDVNSTVDERKENSTS